MLSLPCYSLLYYCKFAKLFYTSLCFFFVFSCTVNGIIKIPTFGGENSPLCYAGFKPFVILKA